LGRHRVLGWLDSSLDREGSLQKRLAFLAFGTGLVLAVTTSGGILGERLSEGSVRAGVLANLATTAVAVLALLMTVRPTVLNLGTTARPTGSKTLWPSLAVAVPQIAGALLGILIVHSIVGHGAAIRAPWLSERPAQFVNDVVAVFATLAVVWGCAKNLDSRVLGVALLVVAAYVATATHWHVDRAPHGFDTTVQQFVVAQFLAAAFALGMFRVATWRSDG